MAELIAFLIEHFQDFDACPPTPDLGHFLEEVGFDEVEVGNALMLLHVLAEQPPLLPVSRRKAPSFRSGI